jgi:hypothetical protein
MMAPEVISPEQQHLDIIQARTEQLIVQLHDKRDAALIFRRNADAKDAEADGVQAELAMLNEARALIGKGLGL